MVSSGGVSYHSLALSTLCPLCPLLTRCHTRPIHRSFCGPFDSGRSTDPSTPCVIAHVAALVVAVGMSLSVVVSAD